MRLRYSYWAFRPNYGVPFIPSVASEQVSEYEDPHLQEGVGQEEEAKHAYYGSRPPPPQKTAAEEAPGRTAQHPTDMSP